MENDRESARPRRAAHAIEESIRRVLAREGVRMRYVRKKKIGAGSAPCIVNLMWLLVEEGCSTFMPKGEYELIGVAVIDETRRNKPYGKLRLWGLQARKERYNFSMRTLADVETKVPDQAFWDDDKRCLTYTAIEDGTRHIDTLDAYLTPRAQAVVKSWGLVDDAPFSERRLYSLDLTKLPEIVASWARPVQFGMIDLMMEEIVREKARDMLNERVEELRPAAPAKAGRGKHHPLTKDKERYEAACYEYRLIGFDPEVDIDVTAAATLEEALEARKANNRRLFEARFIRRLIQFAMDKCGNKWFAEAAPERSGRSRRKKEQTVRVGDFDPTHQGLSLKRVTWTGTFSVTARNAPADCPQEG